MSFARERAGFAIPEIAGKFKWDVDKWAKLESGESKPTAKQLINIADKLDRSPAFFYLDTPPEEEPPLSEFRTINNELLLQPSPKLIKAIREAKRNRDALVELYQLQGKQAQSVPNYLSTSKSLESIAGEIRGWLKIDYEEQKSGYSSSNALTEWRTKIENKDIYIVQYPYVKLEEARGFALWQSEVPIIGINSKDSYNGRIFTLIHELCHVLFRDSVLINDDLAPYFNAGSRNFERRCNKLTAEILAPAAEVKNQFRESYELLGEVNRLAKKFRVSNYVTLIRLKTLSIISEEIFNDLLPSVSFSQSERSQGDGGDPYRNQIVRKGNLLIKNAFESYFDKKISLPELAQITAWKVPNLNKLAIRAFGGNKETQYI